MTDSQCTMRSRLWLAPYWAFLLAIVAMFAACGEQHDNVSQADSTWLRVGALPTSECMPLLYAVHTGMADSMKVKVMLFRSVADIDTALCGGSVDVALTDTVRLALLQAGDSTLQTLFAAKDTLWLVASDSSRVRGAGGFKDKLVGMLRQSDAQVAADRLCSHAQYEEGDVFFIQVADISLRYRMLVSRLIDAAFLPHPYSDAAIAMGHRRIKLPATDTLCQSVWVTRNKKDPRLDAFVRLLRDTAEMHPDTIAGILYRDFQLTQATIDSLKTR